MPKLSCPPLNLHNGRLKVKVIPLAKEARIAEKSWEGESGELKVYVTSPPDKGKANRELLELLKKNYGLRMRIVAGEKSRRKVLESIGHA